MKKKRIQIEKLKEKHFIEIYCSSDVAKSAFILVINVCAFNKRHSEAIWFDMMNFIFTAAKQPQQQ